jgi:hypothetical protein
MRPNLLYSTLLLIISAVCSVSGNDLCYFIGPPGPSPLPNGTALPVLPEIEQEALVVADCTDFANGNVKFIGRVGIAPYDTYFPPRDWMLEVIAYGNYAYIIGSASRDNDGYFFVVDTTDPFNPVIAGNATLSFRQLDSVTMQYYNGRVYLQQYSRYDITYDFLILDVRDPKEILKYEVPRPEGVYSGSIAIEGDIIYVAAAKQIRQYNLKENPDFPQLLPNAYTHEEAEFSDIRVSRFNNKIYVGAQLAVASNSMLILEATDSTNTPSIIGQIDLTIDIQKIMNYEMRGEGMFVWGYYCVYQTTGCFSSIEILNVVTLNSVGKYESIAEVSDNRYRLQVRGDTIGLLNGDHIIIDFSTPSKMAIVSQCCKWTLYSANWYLPSCPDCPYTPLPASASSPSLWIGTLLLSMVAIFV